MPYASTRRRESGRARPSPLEGAILLAIALGAASLAGCGGGSGGGGGGGSASAGASGPGGAAGPMGPTAISRAHQQVAAAAIGTSGAPAAGTPSFDQPAFDAWNLLLARCWPEVRKLIDAELDRSIRAEVASLSSASSGIAVRVRSLTLDTHAALGLSSSGPRAFAIELPRAPATWTVSVEVEAEKSLTTTVFGVPITTTIIVDATAHARDVRVTTGGTIDPTDPRRPQVAGISAPRAQMSFALTSSSPLISQVAASLTQVLDPAVRLALPLGAILAQREVAALVRQTPGFWQPYGTGLPPAAPVSGTIDLEALANEYSALIQRDLMPFGVVVPAEYDQPGWGNGSVVYFHDYGDAPCWTGHYVMGESMRYDLTASAHAEAGVLRALAGLRDCLEVTAPGDGWLSRSAIPLSHPEAARVGFGDYLGVVNGVPSCGIGDISRDQYQGTLLGCVHAYERVPSARPLAREVVSRMLDFCERSDWNVFTGPGSTTLSRSSPMPQSGAFVWAFLQGGALVDPARYSAQRDRHAAITSILWFDGWASSREVHEEYYKFSLGHDNVSILSSIETDPARYRDVIKRTEIDRDVIGHHDNAWFDAVYGAAVPSQAAGMGARVRAFLERWTLRGRRGFYTDLTSDPAIPKVVYDSPMLTQRPILAAAQPIPIEKRVNGDFLWQQRPFELTGGNPPTKQYPGIDLILPYWLARAYGMAR
jgi:hypothetical protein